ncbi:MAG TPA: hypothetical protein VMV29_22585 [Ktedonobacterales bacterium]|nr:hypothetical protein [Ktedonobacterales bacterium]
MGFVVDIWERLWSALGAWGAWLARLLRATINQPAGLTLTGLGCLLLLISTGPPAWPHAPFVVFAVGGSAALLGAFGCFLLATRNEHPHWLSRALRWLALPVMLWALVTAVQSSALLANGFVTTATQRPPHYTSDAMYYMQYSAILVIHGENPYTGPRLAEVMAYYHTHAYTPVDRGRFSDPRHIPTSAELNAVIDEYLAHPDHPPVEVDPRTFASYPAGAFLVAVPTALLGLPSIGFLQLALFLALGVSVIVRAGRQPLRTGTFPAQQSRGSEPDDQRGLRYLVGRILDLGVDASRATLGGGTSAGRRLRHQTDGMVRGALLLAVGLATPGTSRSGAPGGDRGGRVRRDQPAVDCLVAPFLAGRPAGADEPAAGARRARPDRTLIVGRATALPQRRLLRVRAGALGGRPRMGDAQVRCLHLCGAGAAPLVAGRFLAQPRTLLPVALRAGRRRDRAHPPTRRPRRESASRCGQRYSGTGSALVAFP